MTYGNGGKVAYSYDEFDRITGISVDGSVNPCYTYEYGANGHAVRVKDSNLGRTLETEYDLADRPCRSTLKDTNGNIVYRSTLCYDKLSNPVQLREDVNGTHVTDFTYDRDNRVTNIDFGGNEKVKYTYDNLGRVSSRIVENGTDAGKISTDYAFVSGGYGAGSTTPLVQKITQPQIPFEYTYDTRGNIISEKRGSLTTTYAYDALGQLIRVNDPHENNTLVYEYDRGGNMTKRVQYAYTTGTLGSAVNTYTYSYNSQWKDQLVSSNGYPLTYDEIGNLKTYAGWVYEWDAGRRLVKQTQNEKVVAYDYDDKGMRIRQTVSAKTSGYVYAIYNYTYSGNKLVHMTVYNDDLHFFYDNQGRPAKVKYNGVMYTYLHNLQGDIVGIVDGNGTLVVEYKYNAWGSILSRSGSLATTLGQRNPFRYRGYIYDEETWMYWLKSRYYYPELHRFISTDALIGTIGRIIGHNLYTYCRNAPVAMGDLSGFDPRLFYFYGEDQEKHATRSMKDLANEYEVQGYLIASPEDFTNAWNDMYSIVGEDNIDIVVINLHGNPESIDYIDPDSLDYSKSIDTLLFLSCNSGHLGTGKANVAQKIIHASNSNINRLVAADGTHKRGTLLHPFLGIKVKGDKDWKRYRRWEGYESKGFVLYNRDAVGGYSITSIGKAFKSVLELLEKVGW